MKSTNPLLTDVPRGTKMVNVRYRGKTHRVPEFLHPMNSDFDDFAEDIDELQLFVHTGQVTARRAAYERKYPR